MTDTEHTNTYCTVSLPGITTTKYIERAIFRMQKFKMYRIILFRFAREISMISGLNFIWLNVMQIELNFKSTIKVYSLSISLQYWEHLIWLFGYSVVCRNTQKPKILFLFYNANRSFCVVLKLYYTHALIKNSCDIHQTQTH